MSSLATTAPKWSTIALGLCVVGFYSGVVQVLDRESASHVTAELDRVNRIAHHAGLAVPFLDHASVVTLGGTGKAFDFSANSGACHLFQETQSSLADSGMVALGTGARRRLEDSNEMVRSFARSVAVVAKDAIAIGDCTIAQFESTGGHWQTATGLASVASAHDLCDKAAAPELYDGHFAGSTSLFDVMTCAGVVVGPRHLLTAAHCHCWATGSDRLNLVAFGYDEHDTGQHSFPASEVFRIVDQHCPDAEEFKIADERRQACLPDHVRPCQQPAPDLDAPWFLAPRDWSVLVLDKEIDLTAHPIVEFSEPEMGQHVHTLGFPLGAPMVASGPGYLCRSADESHDVLAATLWAENGNSGGPVFDSLGHYVGMVSGNGGDVTFCDDGNAEPRGKCNNSALCDNAGCGVAHVLSSRAIKQAICQTDPLKRLPICEKEKHQ